MPVIMYCRTLIESSNEYFVMIPNKIEQQRERIIGNSLGDVSNTTELAAGCRDGPCCRLPRAVSRCGVFLEILGTILWRELETLSMVKIKIHPHQSSVSCVRSWRACTDIGCPIPHGHPK